MNQLLIAYLIIGAAVTVLYVVVVNLKNK